MIPQELGLPEMRQVAPETGQPRLDPGADQSRSAGTKSWKLGLRILQVRLRFIAVLVVIGLVIGHWDTLKNYWDKWTRPKRSASAAQADTEYYCPMHPQVVRAEPGSCPICGMPLSKRKKVQTTAVELPAGVLSRRQYSPYRVAQAGIQTSEVEYRPLVKEIDTVGVVVYDETGRSAIVTRTAGYIEKLFVDQTWMTVKKGDPLAEIYSPELYSAAQELLVVSEGRGNQRLVDAARQKLRLLGVSDDQIEHCIQTRHVDETLVLRSPQHGHVVSKDVRKGQYVQAGQTLYEVADLSVVWIEAEIYEKDIPFVRVGHAVEASSDAFPNKTFLGRVALVHPHVETASRTNRIRIEMPNSRHELRPGMYLTVRTEVPVADLELFEKTALHGHVLAVPESAVVDTGKHKVVYVEREPGVFDGVAVSLGPRAGGFYPVVEGLRPGDRVATAGAFLLDAETRLNPSASVAYFGASGTPVSRSAQPASQRGPTAARSEQELQPTGQRDPAADALENLNQLAADDRQLALRQKVCPVTGAPLGSMGVPEKLTLSDRPVFLCCKGCRQQALDHSEEVTRKVFGSGNTK